MTEARRFEKSWWSHLRRLKCPYPLRCLERQPSIPQRRGGTSQKNASLRRPENSHDRKVSFRLLYDSFLILKLHEQAVAITCSLTEHQRFETLSIKSRAVNEMTWKSVSVRDVQANSRSSHITLLYGDKITSRTSSKQHGQWLDVSTLGASRWFAPLTKLKTYAELTAIQHSSALHYEKRLWLTDSAFFSVFPDATAQRGQGPPHFLGF